MGKQVYKAHRAMAGVAQGEHFEADEDDPRVQSGLATKVEDADVPDEVRAALDAQPQPGGAPAPETPGAVPTAPSAAPQPPPAAQQV